MVLILPCDDDDSVVGYRSLDLFDIYFPRLLGSNTTVICLNRALCVNVGVKGILCFRLAPHDQIQIGLNSTFHI